MRRLRAAPAGGEDSSHPLVGTIAAMLSRQTDAARRDARSAPPKRLTAPAVVALLVLVLASGCAGDMATRGEALRLVGQDLPAAVLMEAYEGQLHAVGGLRPYTFTLTDGSLPEGIALQNGVLRGVATETGTFEISVEVSDANLSRVSQSYTLRVSAPPPPRFVLVAPQTEIRAPATLRVRLEDARLATAARTRVTWDPAEYELVGEPQAARRDVALLWRGAPGELQVDLAALSSTLSGALELYSFTLAPLTPPVTVLVEYEAEVLTASGDPARQHEFLTGSSGRRAVREPGDQTAPAEEPAPPPEQDGSPEGAADR